jgi:hypothetical protein
MRRCGEVILRCSLIAGPMAILGCVKQRVVGEATTYSPQPWAIAVTGLVAVAAAVAGWFIRRKKKGWGYVLLGGGLLVLATTVPGLALSGATVDPDHVEWSRGFRRYSLRFDDLAGIDHTVKSIPFGRTSQDVHYLVFTRKDGGATTIQVEPDTDHYLRAAIPDILRRARGHGVPCTESFPR